MSSGSNTNQLEKSLICTRCSSELVTDFISSKKSSETIIRCGHCGDLWCPIENLGARDTDAWRSLWFGLASILLIFIAGIPALYYGIKSLARMRFTRINLRDRRAAIAGITLGTLFGVFGSMCLFGVVGTIFINEMTKITTETNQQTIEVLESLASIDVPPQFSRLQGKKFLGSTDFTFSDAEEGGNRNARFDMVFYPPIMFGSVSTIEQQLRNNYLSGKPDYDRVKKENLSWSLLGETVDVRKHELTESWPNGEVNNVLHYHAHKISPKGTFGLAFSFRDPHESFDEETVKAMFESLKPNEENEVDTAWKKVASEIEAAKLEIVSEPEAEESPNK